MTRRKPSPFRGRRAVDLSQLVPPTWTAQQVALQGIFLLGVCYTFYVARGVLLPLVLAVFLSILLHPLVALLARAHLRASVGAGIVLLAVLGLLGVGIARLADPAAEWLQRAPESLPALRQRLDGVLAPAEQVSRAAAQVEQMAAGQPPSRHPAAPLPLRASGFWGRLFTGTKNLLAGAVITLTVLYFLLASGNQFLRAWVEVVPTLTQKKRAVAIAQTLTHTLSAYLTTVTLINLGLGLLTALVMAALGMPSPLLWGALGALLNFIPYVGALVGVLTLGVVALLHFESVSHALLVPASYWALTVLESALVSPLLISRQLALHPVVVICSLVFWSWLWGIPGTLLAVPLLVTCKILCDYSRPLRPLGRFLGRPLKTAPTSRSGSDKSPRCSSAGWA